MAPETPFTLGPDWVKQFMSGMRLLHFLRGEDVTIVPKTPMAPTVLIEILQEIIAGHYQPDRYFRAGDKPVLDLISQPPVVAAGEVYTLLGFNAETQRSRAISTETGGIAFEDPFWAIFAAQAVAEKRNLALPQAKDTLALWANVREAAAAIRRKNYAPAAFFAPISGFHPPDAAPRFALLTIDARQLEALRTRGLQSFLQPPRFFELFQSPAMPRG